MTQDEITAREVQVLGAAPRIAPLPQHHLAEARRLAEDIGATLGIVAPDELTAYFAILFRHPGLYRCQLETGIELLARGRLPAQERELAVLRTAWLCGAPYEWGEHAAIGRAVGLTDDDLERVRLGSEAPGWCEHRRALLRAVEELHAEKMISDATWAVLSRSWDEAQLIELPALVGQYAAVAMVQNSLRLPLTNGRQGLRE